MSGVVVGVVERTDGGSGRGKELSAAFGYIERESECTEVTAISVSPGAIAEVAVLNGQTWMSLDGGGGFVTGRDLQPSEIRTTTTLQSAKT
jgi:hypothetical protein